MRKLVLFVFIPLFCCVSSCQKKKNAYVDYALSIADTNPDSALIILKYIDRRKLIDADLANYSLAYYWSQDKSGLDVNNDSLIRNAYDFYLTKENHQNFARTMYYMGKYFSLVDSTEKAELCFENSIKSSEENKDTATISLALEKLSKILVFHNIQDAERIAERAIETYSNYSQKDTVNLIYFILNSIESAIYNKNFEKAKRKGNEALKLAEKIGNVQMKSIVNQDLAYLYYNIGKQDSALYYAKEAYNIAERHDFSLKLALANSYINVDSINQAKNILKSLDTENQTFN